MDIASEYAKELKALRQAVRAIPSEHWKEGLDDYLIPARLYYHIILCLEWLPNEKDAEEHKRTRRFNLNWLGSVGAMPDQDTALKDIDWMETHIRNWLATTTLPKDEVIARAVYFLRHTRHHLGELSATMRLLGVARPAWE
jgi:hypothetical protein